MAPAIILQGKCNNSITSILDYNYVGEGGWSKSQDINCPYFTEKWIITEVTDQLAI